MSKMKIWVIKRKGADYLGSYPLQREITITENGTDKTIYADTCFYRKKDAELYLKAKLGDYAEYFFEVVGKQ